MVQGAYDPAGRTRGKAVRIANADELPFGPEHRTYCSSGGDITLAVGGDVTITFADAPGAGAGAGPHAASTAWGAGLNRMATNGYIVAAAGNGDVVNITPNTDLSLPLISLAAGERWDLVWDGGIKLSDLLIDNPGVGTADVKFFFA
jgi:hypothetical protein